MSGDAVVNISRLISNYERGIVDASKFASTMLEILLEHQKTLPELADSDFYWHTIRHSDSRSPEQIHAESLSKQPELRRIGRFLSRLILTRHRH